MFCAELRHSLWYFAHIMHACGHWDGEQCCRRKFSFLSHGKPFSIFRAQKTGRFVKQSPKCCFRMLPSQFSKILDHLTWTKSQPGDLKPFRPSRVKRTNVCRIGRKWVRFVVHVHDLTPVIF